MKNKSSGILELQLLVRLFSNIEASDLFHDLLLLFLEILNLIVSRSADHNDAHLHIVNLLIVLFPANECYIQ